MLSELHAELLQSQRLSKYIFVQQYVGTYRGARKLTIKGGLLISVFTDAR